MLAGLGLSAVETDFYRHFLRQPASSPADAGDAMGLTAQEAGPVAERLMSLGLLAGTADGGLRAVHPALACRPLLEHAELRLARQRKELELSRAAVDELAAETGASGTSSLAEAEVHRGAAAAWAFLERIAATARASVRCMAAAGAAPGVGETSDYTAVSALAAFTAQRGTGVQLLLLESIDILPSLVEGARRMAASGVEVRTVPTLPAWTFVVDDEYVATALDPADNQAGLMVVRTPGAVAAATDHFARHWRGAAPLATSDQPAPRDLMHTHRDLLAMLADEMLDETIARRLGVSKTTARRRIKHLLQEFDVRNRTQLVVRAVRMGLLD
ncbi:LuxR C-terminal-related transcriptional regulator [Streptomyces sp. NBC_01423]|uniref:LuxR C-terminal-related transcriptional regulator n=1 Tax=Streptomyces sp. NBC_01423 TaxID=2903860 RepID=UPI002E2DFAE1|nr:LuxR C-terminal-related transcriptional regulator [Streptomyces sp. NBC_01423]